MLGTTQMGAAAPRAVSGGVAIAAYLGGRGAQSCWGVLFGCLALFWYFAYDPEFSPLNGLWRLGPTAEVDGLVQSVIEGRREAMGVMPGVGEVERVTVDGIHYGYQGPDGTPLTGVARGLKQGYHEKIAEVGAVLRVVYSKADPTHSYIKGLRGWDETEYFFKGLAFWFAAFIGLLSLGCIFCGLKSGPGRMRLLARGALAQGRIVNISAIPFLSQFNVWRLRYVLCGAEHTVAHVWCSTTRDEISGEPEPVLYADGARAKILPLSQVPGGVHIDGENRVVEGAFSPYNYLLLPILCTLGYVWFALWGVGFMNAPWVF